MRLCISFVLCLLFLSCSNNSTKIKEAKSGKNGSIVHYQNFESNFIRPRNIDVWLPKNYSEKIDYKVLYMHDGQNLFSLKSSYGGENWDVDVAIERLVAEGKIAPTIVVGIWNTDDRTIEYTPLKPYNLLGEEMQDSFKRIKRIVKKPASDEYLKFIVHELKPFIDSAYSTANGPANTFIAGASMGGLISLYAQVEYPKIFGGAACISTHWPLALDKNRNDFTKAFGQYLLEAINPRDTYKLYFDYGTKSLDAWYEAHQLYINDILNKVHRGPRLYYKVEGAKHNAVYWRQRFYEIADYLLKS